MKISRRFQTKPHRGTREGENYHYFLASVSSLPQYPSDQEIYRAYSPGHYPHDGGQTILRSTPRLIAVRQGTPVLRAIPNRSLKRIRVAQAPVAANYAVEQPLTSAQNYPPTYRTVQSAAQQPAYYVQRQPSQYAQYPQPAPRPPRRPFHVVKHARPIYQQEEEEEQQKPEEEYPSDPNPQYNFSFDVKDDELTNYQNRQEEREDGVIKGSYSVVDPDGYVRTVTYTADSKNGFQAKVVREPTDVKVKFPVPTEAPEEQPVYRHSKHVLRTQQVSSYPSHQHHPHYTHHPQPVNVYSQQPEYRSAPTQPTYVVRRFPAGSATVNRPRVVKVLRAQY